MGLANECFGRAALNHSKDHAPLARTAMLTRPDKSSSDLQIKFTNAAGGDDTMCHQATRWLNLIFDTCHSGDGPIFKNTGTIDVTDSSPQPVYYRMNAELTLEKGKETQCCLKAELCNTEEKTEKIYAYSIIFSEYEKVLETWLNGMCRIMAANSQKDRVTLTNQLVEVISALFNIACMKNWERFSLKAVDVTDLSESPAPTPRLNFNYTTHNPDCKPDKFCKILKRFLKATTTCLLEESSSGSSPSSLEMSTAFLGKKSFEKTDERKDEPDITGYYMIFYSFDTSRTEAGKVEFYSLCHENLAVVDKTPDPLYSASTHRFHCELTFKGETRYRSLKELTTQTTSCSVHTQTETTSSSRSTRHFIIMGPQHQAPSPGTRSISRRQAAPLRTQSPRRVADWSQVNDIESDGWRNTSQKVGATSQK